MLPDAHPPKVGEAIVVEGDEARHAQRVKRLHEGDHVEILNGRGLLARGVIDALQRRRMTVVVEEVGAVEPIRPRLEVFAATPKGGRVDELVRGLSQVGAASWTPLIAAHSVVDAGGAKIERLRAIAVESAKQCGRAWTLEITDPAGVEDAMTDGAIVADARGGAYEARGGDRVRVLIGPEGGWSEPELAAAPRVCCFGSHVMRIEVAAVAAAAIVLDAERRLAGEQ